MNIRHAYQSYRRYLLRHKIAALRVLTLPSTAVIQYRTYERFSRRIFDYLLASGLLLLRNYSLFYVALKKKNNNNRSVQ